MLLELLKEKGTPVRKDANYLKMPVYLINNNEAGATQFNVLYQEIMSMEWNQITRTPSGGVSIAKKSFRPPMWDVRNTNACIEITVIWKTMLRIQFRQGSDVATEEKSSINGHQAFLAFAGECKKRGVNLGDYAVSAEEGLKAKAEIEPYIIKLEREIYLDKVFDGCHHLDFHNSFPAGLANTHEEFRPIVEYFYEKRKENPLNKAVLNYTIGYFQSVSGCKARYATLSRDAINDNNKRLRELAEELKRNGRVVLLWNTDGIWYKGDIYHGEGEGKKLGEWENDHTNCRLRIKSRGAYEFIEDGKYYPVLRGHTKRDRVVPRKDWEWGDIYKADAEVLKFYWHKGVGITDENGKLY